MSLLVRKINAVKWRKQEFLEVDKIPADAITSGCLKTDYNGMSVWKIDSIENLEDAVIAIVSSGQHIKTMDFVVLDPDLLSSEGINVVTKEMDIPYAEQRRNHVELTNLSYTEIGIIARQIFDKIKITSEKRYVEGQLVDMLRRVAKEGRLREDLLDDDIKKRIIPDPSTGDYS